MNNLILEGISVEALSATIQSIVADEVKTALTQLSESVKKDNTSEYLTRKETAEILGVSLPTLHSYVKKGFLTAQRVGEKTIRFRREDVEKALTAVEPIKYRRA
jgi:excisionase family DNA binding protein